ncbi:MAG: VOC family protein [Chloroflexi bacterium]|nr:VOC family protein [Chloroflexota bacterium]
MITGVHALIFNHDADALRTFVRDVLGFASIDVGGRWLIFALPPAELGIHPIDASETGRHELYLMCDDIHQTVAELAAKGVEFPKPIEDQGFGLVTSFKIPGGAELALYQPRHPTATQLNQG